MKSRSENQIVVAALYKFAPLENLKGIQEALRTLCRELGIKGTLLLAHEGVNGTVSGTREAIGVLRGRLGGYVGLDSMEYKESLAPTHPFHRLKIRLKKEIVTMGRPEVDPNRVVGAYVAPEEWNDIISDPEVVVIDTRNDYEVEIGTFRGAVNPKTQSFSEFPRWVRENLDPGKNKKVAMFCTGGIRCEKASSYMRQAGFEEVYHLKGGILKYLEKVPEAQSLWEGDCFVFDQRVAVRHGLEKGIHDMCFGCRHPVSPVDKVSPRYAEGVCCPHCHDSLSEEQKAGAAERHRQVLLAAARGEKHIGSGF